MASINNFEIDVFLSSNPDVSTFGLNLTTAWPFPVSVRREYEAFAKELRSLDTALYVYPYDELHITVMTLIDFKQHIQPDASYLVEAEQTVVKILPCVINVFNATGCFSQPTLKFDRAVLSDRTAYLVFHNPDGTISRLRDSLVTSLQDLNLQVHYSPFVHSTVARFLKKPASPTTLRHRFVEVASKFSIPDFEIDEILLTAELKPYMRQCKILAHFPFVGKGLL